MKKTKQKKDKNNITIKTYILNILIALFIFFLALFINDIKPFGPYDLAKYDGFFQYKPMLFNFLKNIQEGTLSNFSFLNGLGNSLFFNYTYYLSSPINLLALPFKNANTMYLVVITIKLIITTITTTFFASKKTDNKLLSTIIPISYVFSAWFLAYNQSIMWLDAFMMFPLFQYGLEQLLNESKPFIYIFSLAYIMISNFYMAWMICLYTLAYFIYQVLLTKKDKKIKLKQFNTITLATIVTILLAFCYIYITFDSFMNIDIYINSSATDETTIPILNLIKSFFSGNTTVILSNFGETFPNITVNTIFTISLLYYFINNKIDKKDRVRTLIIFIFTIILFYSNTLNYLMNCFHIPIGYNFRYSFLISFFMIYLFIKNYQTFDNKIDKKVLIINSLLLVLLVLQIVFKNIETRIFLLSLIPLITYSLYFILYKNTKLFKYLFAAIILIEITTSSIFNITPEMKSIEDNYTYHKNTNYREIINHNIENGYLENVSMYENRNALPYFSSMQYNPVLYDLQTLGCITDSKANLSLCPNTQIFKTLLNIKTDNEYHLEKIFPVHKYIQYIALNDGSFYENQNLLIKTIANTENNILEKTKLEATKKNKTHYKVEKSGTYYLNLKGIYQVIKVNNNAYTYDEKLVKDKEVNINIVQDSIYLKLELNKKDIIEITYPTEEDIEEKLETYYFNKEEFTSIYNSLKEHQIKYTSYQDDNIKGTITVNKDQIIFTSIPYDNNWKVKIDGKETKPILLLNSLMGIECKEGKHTIELIYKPNYTSPIIISSLTFISLIIVIIIKKRK